MPSTAKPVVTVEESLMLSNGNSPVRINHRPSKSIPRFLPAKLVSAMLPPFNAVSDLITQFFFDAAAQFNTTVKGAGQPAPLVQISVADPHSAKTSQVRL